MTHETATLIGGPMARGHIVTHQAEPAFEVCQPGASSPGCFGALGYNQQRKGRYVRLAGTKPAVFMWQGWV